MNKNFFKFRQNRIDENSSYEELISIVNSSANDIKFAILFMLIAEIFVLITVSSITDLQLLIRSDMYAVPFLGFSVDVVGFFIFSPIFLIIFNYHVSSSLVHHSKSLMYIYELAKIKGRKGTLSHEVKENFVNFVFSSSRDDKILVYANMSFLLSFFPIFIQFFLMIRFLDYQSVMISSYHFLCIILSCYISICYWQRLSCKEFLNERFDSHWVLIRYLYFKLIKECGYKVNGKKNTKSIVINFMISMIIFIIVSSVFGHLYDYIEHEKQLISGATDTPSMNFDFNFITTFIESFSDWLILLFVLISFSILIENMIQRCFWIFFYFLSILILSMLEFKHFFTPYNVLFLLLFFILSMCNFKNKFKLLRIQENYNKTRSSRWWYFFEFYYTLSVSLLSLFSLISLILLLFLAKNLEQLKVFGEHNQSNFFKNIFVLTKNMFPHLEVEEEQIFDLSKSAQLFELSNTNASDYDFNMNTFRKCVSYSDDICHFIKPMFINNRNLLFSNFKNSIMYQVRVRNSDLSYSDFSQSHLEGAKFDDSIMHAINLSQSMLEGSTFDNVQLSYSKIKYSDIQKSSFLNVSLDKLNICNVSFSNASFRNSSISCNKISDEINKEEYCNCNLSSYDLNAMFLSNTTFNDIHIENHTRSDDKSFIYFNNINPINFIDHDGGKSNDEEFTTIVYNVYCKDEQIRSDSNGFKFINLYGRYCGENDDTNDSNHERKKIVGENIKDISETIESINNQDRLVLSYELSFLFLFQSYTKDIEITNDENFKNIYCIYARKVRKQTPPKYEKFYAAINESRILSEYQKNLIVNYVDFSSCELKYEFSPLPSPWPSLSPWPWL
ncbi:Uncharacterized protein YjbI, contains pentapeptide repeats [Vibrio xiamenensis]|uniref:Uncharacterized protein YjbI, contains pentapeptide repeats n=1 Tax=Vibrio xiamenensis TaxID=861298 RepID=A0A1G8CTL3_9VIBR|nr:pentapeptide repeat-containing protein [Vibrio xiamenensis]SDH48634.1 Uncharacterized protein YjbI, contains pentapeptide repeats [Vibrio xiamenensis]